MAAGILSCFGVALVGAARRALLFVSTRKIAGSYCSKASFTEQLQKTGEAGVSIQDVGKDQTSIDRID